MAESALAYSVDTDEAANGQSPDNSSSVPMVRSPKGGLLRQGNPGNRGGGRIANDVRQQLVGSFYERIPVLLEIADGVASVPSRVQLRHILPHVKCECGSPKLVPASKGWNADYVEIPALAPPTPKERLMALDLAAKYGLGAMKDVSTEQVRERMRQTLELIRAKCPPELAGELISAMRPIWL